MSFGKNWLRSVIRPWIVVVFSVTKWFEWSKQTFIFSDSTSNIETCDFQEDAIDCQRTAQRWIQFDSHTSKIWASSKGFGVFSRRDESYWWPFAWGDRHESHASLIGISLVGPGFIWRVLFFNSREEFETPEMVHGEKVVEYYELYEGGDGALEVLWREHFVNTMSPMFLPDKWSVDFNHERSSWRVWWLMRRWLRLTALTTKDWFLILFIPKLPKYTNFFLHSNQSIWVIFLLENQLSHVENELKINNQSSEYCFQRELFRSLPNGLIIWIAETSKCGSIGLTFKPTANALTRQITQTTADKLSTSRVVWSCKSLCDSSFPKFRIN